MPDEDNVPTIGRKVLTPQQSKDAYRDLLADPLRFLRLNPVKITVDETVDKTKIIDDAGLMYDTSRTVTINTKRIALLTHATDIKAIATPTRVVRTDTGAISDDRLAPVEIFNTDLSGPKLWLTDQQSGCTLLMLDWGFSKFSMVHLLPHQTGDYTGLSHYVLALGSKRSAGTVQDVLQSIGGRIGAQIKNSSLRKEAATVVENSAGVARGQAPARYMMVQSQNNIASKMFTQVLGVLHMGTWRFYVQTRTGFTGTNAIKSVKEMQWRNWTGKLSRHY